VIALGALALSPATGAFDASDPVATTSGKGVVFPSRCGARKSRPSTIVVACADAGFIIDSISWSSWGGRSATGGGTGVTKTCDPSCAAGGFEKHPISVTLFRKVRCKTSGLRQYTRLSYHFTDDGPSFGPKSDVLRYPC
jgi:hypothetical protein